MTDSPVDVAHIAVYRVRQAKLLLNGKMPHGYTYLNVCPSMKQGQCYVATYRGATNTEIPVNAEDCRTLSTWFAELAKALDHETKYKETTNA